MNNLTSIFKIALVQVLLLASISCKTTGPLPPRLENIAPPQQLKPAQKVVNLSGDWGKNYQRSDNYETVFNDLVLKIQRRIEQLQRRDEYRNPSVNVELTSIPSRESLIGLARFTEEVTRMQLLHIEQDQDKIKIDREDDFSLLCKFFDQQSSSRSDTFGTENCSWNQGQLFLKIILQDELSLYYQVTLSPDAQELNITTTIRSSVVSYPITISNYYDRYTPPEGNFDCIQTLTRNDVCKRSRD